LQPHRTYTPTSKEGELDMSPLDDIRKQYTALIEREDATSAKLAETRVKLADAHDVDVAATAEAALAGKPAPKRTELTLRHAEENLVVELEGIDEGVWRLQQEARAAVGEGRDFPIFIPEGIPATRAEVVADMKAHRTREDSESEADFVARLESQIPRGYKDAESIVREAHRQRGISLDRRLPRLTDRPDDLIEWVEAAYEAEDKAAAKSYEFQAKKQRGHAAIEAVNRAKAEHVRRGHPGGSFNIRSYPDIVLPEHLAEMEVAIGRSPFEKAREQVPSFEEAQNEPVAEPEPVNEEAEFRKREIAGAAPPAAPDAKPINNPDADLAPEERAAARAARLAAHTAHLDVPPSQTPIVEEAA
jgi:hypothetical protein